MSAQPLAGVGIVEFAGIGPAPFACLYLERLGATVIRVDRPGGSGLPGGLESIGRRRRVCLSADLKTPRGRADAFALVDAADVLIEGFRPGVMERLGLGPDAVAARNARLIFARVTGWGQDGPMAQMAGHDINYIGLVGALGAIGTPAAPIPPLNLVGDYGGGAMFVVAGVLAALLERATTGRGQVVDSAIVDGTAALMEPIRDLADAGLWVDRRGANLLDGGAPFYTCYRTADGGHMAVGALEPQFYSALVEGLGLREENLPSRMDPTKWDELRTVIGRAFREHTRDHWEATFAGTDACVTPVLSIAEAPAHPHNAARSTIPPGDTVTPISPRFSEASTAPNDAPAVASDSQQPLEAILEEFGVHGPEVSRLVERGLVSWQ